MVQFGSSQNDKWMGLTVRDLEKKKKKMSRSFGLIRNGFLKKV